VFRSYNDASLTSLPKTKQLRCENAKSEWNESGLNRMTCFSMKIDVTERKCGTGFWNYAVFRLHGDSR
jgi:hypothetical protein